MGAKRGRAVPEQTNAIFVGALATRMIVDFIRFLKLNKNKLLDDACLKRTNSKVHVLISVCRA